MQAISTKARLATAVAAAHADRAQSPALAALRVLRDTCSAAIDALQQPFSETQISLLDSRPTCAVLYKDFQSLLTLIYTSTTKVTLVLRPSAPAPAAALAPIKDLGTSITSFATCATLFNLHGAAVASDARLLAREVCEAVRALASMFVDSAGEDYLVRTGTVHDVVEKARRDLPADNLAAVKKRWKADREMIGDSLEEINAMLEDTGGGEDELEGADLDDEWDELGFGASKKMSEAELERTKKVRLCKAILVYPENLLNAPELLSGTTSCALRDSLPQTGSARRTQRPDKLCREHRKPQLSAGFPALKVTCCSTRGGGGRSDTLCTTKTACACSSHL